ncbi:MAG TPA: nucleotidyltransferase domain-containing protein [bacterium]|nr:nucleotidyltransferase domain-containing protein [bacterium]
MTDKYGIPDNLWSQIIDLFPPYQQIESVVLFGSRALGTFHNGSDIDLCLKGLCESDIKLKILNQYEELYFPWKLDLIIWQNIQNQDLKDHITRVGIIVC